MDSITATRYLLWVMSFIGILVWIVYILKHRQRWFIAVAPLTYFVNSLALYTYGLLNNSDLQELFLWSNVVRLHSIFLFIGFGILLLTRSFSWTQHQ